MGSSPISSINHLLLGVVAVGSLGYTLSVMGTEQRQLKIAKEDFTSIHALWRARAISYWANSEESRYLVDQAHAADRERDFIRKSEQMAKLPRAMKLADVAAAERSGIHLESFSGYLADELNNITFPGEREAAVEMLVRFEKYLGVDKRIRQIETSGRHRDAIDLCIGTKLNVINSPPSCQRLPTMDFAAV
jgi:hypothetical protein